MRKKHLAQVLTIVVMVGMFTSCTQVTRQGENSASGVDSSSAQEVSVPEELSGFQDDPRTTFMLNLNVNIADAAMRNSRKVENTYEFDYDIGELKANIVMQNGLDGSTETGLVILCDGIPVEYTVEETGETGFCQTFEVEGRIQCQVKFTPEFASGIGRIDFVQLPFPQNGEMTYHTNDYSLYAVLPENYETPEKNCAATVDAVPVREGVKGGVNGKGIMMWMFDPYGNYEESGTPGMLQFDIDDKDETLVEMLAGVAGSYRVAFFLDGEPLALVDDKMVLDCKLGEEEMLSLRVPLKGMIPEGEHTFFAVATRIDEEYYQYLPMFSVRYGLIN